MRYGRYMLNNPRGLAFDFGTKTYLYIQFYSVQELITLRASLDS